MAKIFLHPAITIFAALKVIFEATVTFALMETELLYVIGFETVNELKEEVSKTSVTVIVIVCVPTLFAESVADIVRS